MLGSRSFRAATQAATPNFAAATARQGELEQRAMAEANALRSQNTLGAANLYNKGMGDKSPIADFASDMYDNVSGPDMTGESSIVGRDAGSIDPMNIGDGSDISNVTGGETFGGDFDPQGNYLDGDPAMSMPELDTGIDPSLSMRDDITSAVDSAEMAGDVATEAVGDQMLDGVTGNLGGIARVATAEDPAGEAGIQAALQAAQLVPGLGQAAMVANFLRGIV
jgi:hypothetical protein